MQVSHNFLKVIHYKPSYNVDDDQYSNNIWFIIGKYNNIDASTAIKFLWYFTHLLSPKGKSLISKPDQIYINQSKFNSSITRKQLNDQFSTLSAAKSLPGSNCTHASRFIASVGLCAVLKI